MDSRFIGQEPHVAQKTDRSEFDLTERKYIYKYQ